MLPGRGGSVAGGEPTLMGVEFFRRSAELVNR